MRHRTNSPKLDRSRGSRTALSRTMLAQLIENETIEITLAKAKFLRPQAERLITEAKKQTLAARRNLISQLGDVPAVSKLLSDVSPRFKERNGGYTRIIRTKTRSGDMAQMATLSLVELKKREIASTKKEGKGDKKTEAKKEKMTTGEKKEAVITKEASALKKVSPKKADTQSKTVFRQKVISSV